MIKQGYEDIDNLSRREKMKDMKPPHIDRLLSDYVKEYAARMPNKTAINFYGREITYRGLPPWPIWVIQEETGSVFFSSRARSAS